MNQRIAHVTIVVKDYDEAITFYTEKLGFYVVEDTPLSPTKRWVLVAPSGARECSILLAKADSIQQEKSVGYQTGGRVGFFLFTDDFWRDYTSYKKNGLKFVRPPEEMPYGTVAVFQDLYGNLWDLLQPNESNKGVL